jgi:hypothetical protein
MQAGELSGDVGFDVVGIKNLNGLATRDAIFQNLRIQNSIVNLRAGGFELMCTV